MRFFLFDRVISFTPQKQVSGIKNVSVQEEFFINHFDRQPVMPEPLIIESIAQLGGWAVAVSSEYKYSAIMVMVKNVKAHHQVRPGDSILLQATIEGINEYGATISGRAEVDGRCVLEVSSITYGLYPIPENQLGDFKRKYMKSSDT